MSRLTTCTALAIAGAVGMAQPLLAREVELPRVPRFVVAPSPIGLRGDVRPLQYVGVVGRKAAWLGLETGEAELWVHPLKLAQRFQIDFKVPDYEAPIRGADLARTIEVRPELTTITYTHATFTVRQHILAPLDEPALLVLVDVDTIRPLELVVTFTTVLQYAWPAGLGGQYASWDESLEAFVLSESLRRHNAVIGSPWARRASSHPAHAVPDAPNVFTVPIDAARARREFVPIAVVAGIEPREAVATRYRTVIANAERLYAERRSHADALREKALSISSPDDRLDLAVEWAKVNLDEQVVCNPDLGCGLVAGWGPSGRGTRPGFGWFFGGDAAINSLAMSVAGLTDQVATGLRFLGRYQRDDGKITHEVSQAAGRIPWFTDYPYPYYHADTTPFWLVAVWRYWRATGDQALVDELWPRVRKAYDWCLSAESDGDGIIENTLGGLGAIEVGDIGKDIHQDIYLAAVWMEALKAVEALARARGDRVLADGAASTFSRASATLNEKYWIASAGHHAFGLLTSGTVNDALTVWPATAASFGLLEPAAARRTLAQIASARMTTDWGTRMLASDHPLYEATHYNMGAVWPFVTGFVAWGHYAYERPWSGFPLVEALARLTFDWARGRHPELLSGRFYRPLDTAVPHQFFATSMFVTPLVRGLLGWEPDAPNRRASLAPQLPPQWAHFAASNLQVGASTLGVKLSQDPVSLTARLSAAGPAIDVDLTPMLPPGATLERVTVDGRVVGRAAEPVNRRPTYRVAVGSREATVRIAWRGGLMPDAPVWSREPGGTSRGPHLTDFTWAGSRWTLDVEGRAGETYEVTVRGAALSSIDGAELVDRSGYATRVRVRMPASTSEWSATRIAFTPSR